jgi:CheY-like chemotaxis protein
LIPQKKRQEILTLRRLVFRGEPVTQANVSLMNRASLRAAARPIKRILVAEDDAAICALLDRVLGLAGSVATVPDAETALRLLSSEPFDMVISDFMLPGMNGLELVERIRALPHNKMVPVLIISGHARCGLEDRARDAGADAYLDKPFTLSQLRAAIVRLLGSGPSLRSDRVAAR